jgi:hypothetical protein
MAKNKGGKSSGKVSAGINSNVNSKTLNSIRRERLPSEVLMNKLNAYLNGSDPWMVIDNPNKEQTNKKKIRVKASTMYGSLKERKLNPYIIKSMLS